MANEVNRKTKNTMPGFVRGTLAHIQKAITDEKINAPCFCFLTDTDKKCLAFLDIDNVLYQINLDRIEKLEESVAGMVDPTSGEPISVPEYVEKNLEPVQTQVEVIVQQSTTTQAQVEALSNAITMITGKDLNPETTEEPSESTEESEENNETPTPPLDNNESEVETNG